MEKTANKTILLVEDDTIIAMAETHILRKFGYAVITAYNSENAIHQVHANKEINLILMDIDLGEGIDGTQAAEIILKDHDIPIVFLSSHMEPEIVEKTEKITSYGYILKNSGNTVLDASIKMAFKLFEAHKKIFEREQYFMELFQQAPLGYHSLDEEGIFVEVNQTLLDILGYKREEIIGKWFGDLLPSNEAEAFRERFPSFKALGKMHAEFHLIQKDGGLRLFSFDGRIGYKTDGTINCTYGLSTDITEKRQAEERLSQSQALLNEMGEIAKIGGWRTDIETHNVVWTDELYNTYEVDSSFSPTVEKSIEFCTPETRPLLIQANQRLMDEGLSYNIVVEILTAKGKRRWIQIIGRPGYTDGKITFRVGTSQDITERRRAEEELLQNQILLNETGKLAHVGGWRFNIENQSIQWTEEMYHIFEVPPSFVPDAANRMEFYTPESRRLLESSTQRLMETGEPYVIEVEIITLKGNRKWLRMNGRISTTEGNITSRLGGTQDITEQKLSEDALIQSRNLLDEMSRIAKIAGWRVDANALQAEWSEELYHIYEVDSSFIPTTENALEFYIPDSRAKFAEAIKNVMEMGTPYDLELELITAKGNHRWLHIIGRAGYTDGKITHRVGITQDITDRKRIEEKLKESELKYRTYIEHSSDVVFSVDENGEYKFVNQVFASTFGKSPDYFIGKSFWDIYPKEDADHRQATSKKVFETGESQSVEVVVPLPDRTLYFLAKANPIKDESGKVVMNLTHAIDITERKLAEEKVKKLLTEKEILLKEVQHRIKNNMMTMQSLLALQADNENEPSVVTALKEAQNRFQAMGILYDKLFRTGNLKEMAVKDYLSALAVQIVKLFPNSASVNIDIKIEDFVLEIKELSFLGIIVNELITNSMKYAFQRRDHGLLKLKASKNDNQVTMTVEDNGIGLPETVDIKNSTGFGLMLIDALTNQLNGTIHIEREKGTKFVLKLDVK